MRDIVVGRPEPSEYAPFFAGYVAKVLAGEILEVLEDQRARVVDGLSDLSDDRVDFRYAEGKWTVRQVLGHVNDAERVFGYRALCIARGEAAPLPGFDEQLYMANAPFAECAFADLRYEFDALRRANVLLLRQLDEAAWRRQGTANGTPVTVRALAYIMAGHVEHHLGILRERYQV
jgi:uncharacterized damage-inducible protein DinB